MFTNLFLRFTWTLTLTPFSVFNDRNVYQFVVVPVIIVLELYRRFQWSLLRVEWAHVKQSAARGFNSVPVFFDNEREREARRAYALNPSLLGETALYAAALIIAAVLGAVA